MTPETLAKYLDVMRERGVMHAALDLWVDGAKAVVSVTFGPDAMPMPGDPPTPGSWKSPTRLDDPAQFDREEP